MLAHVNPPLSAIIYFTGACVSAVEYNYDLFSDDGNLAAVTNMLFLQLINPETHAFMDVPQLAYPIRYAVPLKRIGDQQFHYNVS